MATSPVTPAVHPDVLRATQCDAAGRFDEAIDHLAHGARSGDALCLRLLGLRLATGDRAPLMVMQGLDLLGEALAAGDAEAGARLAGLLALGAHLPAPEGQAALQCLARAAALGHSVAQRQLLALCGEPPRATGAAPAVDWQAMAARVDLRAWGTAPAGTVLHADPRVVTFHGLISPALSAFLISLAPERLEPARVYDPVRREDVVMAHRNNTQASFSLQNVELAQALLQWRMAAACGVASRQMEGPTILHYSPGEQIRNHFDFVDPDSVDDYAAEIARNGQRVITFLVYLNEEYEGGETDFPELGVRYKGRTGDGIYFVNALADLSPDRRTVHAGLPPARGEKWLVTQFVRSRAMR